MTFNKSNKSARITKIFMDIDNTIWVGFVSQNKEIESVDPVKSYYL